MLTKIILAVMAALLIAASSGELQQELDDLQAERNEITQEYEEARARMFESETEAARLGREVTVREIIVRRLTDQANEVAVSMLKGELRSQPEMMAEYLVHSESVGDASFLTHAQQRQRISIEQVRAEQARIARIRLELEEATERAAADAAELEAQEQALQESIASTESDLERAKRAEERARQIAAAKAAASRGVDFSSPGPSAPSNGNYACPLDPSVTSFIDSWGFPRSGGRRHKGTDIMGPTGSLVYAYTDGVISRHSNNRLGGISLYLTGEDGFTYYYAHLQGYTSQGAVGTVVSAGDHIAFNGSTGNASASAPHIHLEQHPAGNRNAAVNPYRGLAAACF